MTKVISDIKQMISTAGVVTLSKAWYALGRRRPEDEATDVIQYRNIEQEELIKELEKEGIEVRPFPGIKSLYYLG